MKGKGLTPNEEADKERLLKRVSLDLPVLPPSMQMMDDFLPTILPMHMKKWLISLLQTQHMVKRWRCTGWMLRVMRTVTVTRMIISAHNGHGAIG